MDEGGLGMGLSMAKEKIPVGEAAGMGDHDSDDDTLFSGDTDDGGSEKDAPTCRTHGWGGVSGRGISGLVVVHPDHDVVSAEGCPLPSLRTGVVIARLPVYSDV